MNQDFTVKGVSTEKKKNPAQVVREKKNKFVPAENPPPPPSLF